MKSVPTLLQTVGHISLQFPTFQLEENGLIAWEPQKGNIQLAAGWWLLSLMFPFHPLWCGLWFWLMLNQLRTWFTDPKVQGIKCWSVAHWARYDVDKSEACKIFKQNLNGVKTYEPQFQMSWGSYWTRILCLPGPYDGEQETMLERGDTEPSVCASMPGSPSSINCKT